MVKVVPIFVAAMVWLIRVLIIGTFSVAGERLFTLADVHNQYSGYRTQQNQPQSYRPAQSNVSSQPAANYSRPAPKPRPASDSGYNVNRPEPTYHPVGMNAMNHEQNQSTRR